MHTAITNITKEHLDQLEVNNAIGHGEGARLCEGAMIVFADCEESASYDGIHSDPANRLIRDLNPGYRPSWDDLIDI